MCCLYCDSWNKKTAATGFSMNHNKNNIRFINWDSFTILYYVCIGDMVSAWKKKLFTICLYFDIDSIFRHQWSNEPTQLHPIRHFHLSHFFLLLTGRKKLKDTRKKGLFFKLLDEIKELKYRRRSPIYWKVLNKPTSCLFFVYSKKRRWLSFI